MTLSINAKLGLGLQWREAKAQNQGKPAARVLFSLAHWSAPVNGGKLSIRTGYVGRFLSLVGRFSLDANHVLRWMVA